jgi:hypothetical protein
MYQYQPSEDTIKALAFNKSPIWDFVVEVLNASVQAEVSIAISQELTAERRAHAAGRAEAMVDLQNYLAQCRQEAVEKHQKVSIS